MKKLNTLLIAVLFSSLLVSCYKDAYKVDPNFVGGWSSTDDNFFFEIFENDGSYYTRQGEKIIDKIKVSNTKLKIGNKKFIINQFPRLDSTITNNLSQFEYYSMVLDGVVYINLKRKI